MKGDIQTLRSEYDLKKSQYEKLCNEIKAQLSELLRREHIALALPIESRVKPWESISQKCERRNVIPAALGEMGDIAGLRTVLLFRRDQGKVCEIIQKHFEVLEVEDTANRLSADQFGYGSVHFNVKPKAEWLVVPTLSELQGLQAEIQVRTASQHIWAEASHALQYKRESHVPQPLRRAINRVAALLETVDLEFERVLSGRETYVDELSTFEGAQPLNTDVLEKILTEELPPENKGVDENFSELLDDLIAFNVDGTKSLKVLLERHYDAILAADRAQVQNRKKYEYDYTDVETERLDKGVFFTHAGLTRSALREEFGDDFDTYMKKRFSATKPTDKQRPH